MTGWQPGDPLPDLPSVGWVRGLFEVLPEHDCVTHDCPTNAKGPTARWPKPHYRHDLDKEATS